MTDAPSIYELMDQYKTPQATRQAAAVLLAPAVAGPPMDATPGLPPDRVKILRDASRPSLKDPALLEELKMRRWAVEAIGGEELAKLAKGVVSQPPELIDRMMTLLGNQLGLAADGFKTASAEYNQGGETSVQRVTSDP